MSRDMILLALTCVAAFSSSSVLAAGEGGALPEGNRGIAAKYPQDRGIERDPAVVFADDFEAMEADRFAPGYRKQKGKKWDNAYGPTRITQQAENVHSGKKALEVAMGRPQGMGAARYFKKGFETLHVRYYAKYAKMFPGSHHTGMSISARAPGVPDACPGVRANGRNKFTVLLDTCPPRPPWSNARPPGYAVIYCYHMDQQHKWGEQWFPSGKTLPGTNGKQGLFGKQFVSRPDFLAQRARWYCYELMVRTNTPGKRDGRIAFWIGGKLTGDFPNLRLRSVETLKADRIKIGMYASKTQANKTMWYDDVVAATSYIGPMAAPPRRAGEARRSAGGLACSRPTSRRRTDAPNAARPGRRQGKRLWWPWGQASEYRIRPLRLCH